MLQQTLYHTYQRYRTLQTHLIKALPIVILMPHSACNCRCVMCDIWKGNNNQKQLTEGDMADLLHSLQSLGTKEVVFSGGEALLNPRFFSLCRMLKEKGLKITLLSTGLLLKKYVRELLAEVDEIIVSLDGPEDTHDRIRNIPGAFAKLKEGVIALKESRPSFRISARTVIHKLNFKEWPLIIKAARELCLDRISFLPADVSSHAFNREVLWSSERQNEILVTKEDLPLLEQIVKELTTAYAAEFVNHFIAESPAKIQNIVEYYKAVHGLASFPFKKCNAPWVSAVVEADGLVKPCFFHAAYGNVHQQSLTSILNSETAVRFRKSLNMEQNDTCRRCVCSLHLSPRLNPAKIL